MKYKHAKQDTGTGWMLAAVLIAAAISLGMIVHQQHQEQARVEQTK